MLSALTGRKAGMTRLFEEDGRSVPVTVIQVEETRVLDRRTKAKDGYEAVRLASGTIPRRAKSVHRSQLSKAGIEDCGGHISEVQTHGKSDDSALEAGASINVEQVFAEGERVDIVGTSKGKGFAGTIKRFNFAQQDNTHGNSRSHRVAGTTGQNQLPGRVFPGKKMPGHMGAVTVCKQNLPIMRIIPEDRLVLVRGSIPGHINTRVVIRKSKRVPARSGR